MGKVITSAGLNEFISSGKVDEIKNAPRAKVAAQAPPLEVETPKPTEEPGKVEPPPPADAPPDEIADDEATKEATAASEALRDAINKKNATINRKHREMKEAQEAARDAEEFAKAQWNEKRLADERAQALEKELTELKGKAAPVAAVVEAAKPDPTKFYDDKGQFKAFEYAEALAAFSSEQAVKKFEAKQLEERRAQETKQAEDFARARVQAAIKAHPDFEEVTQRADVKTHPMLISYLSASEQLGEVSYYLAKNPEYLARINAMNPLKAIAEIGVLEKTFEKSPSVAPPATEAATQKTTPGAPAPIKPLSQTAAVQINTDPAKMTYKELRAYERQRQAQKMRR